MYIYIFTAAWSADVLLKLARGRSTTKVETKLRLHLGADI